MEELKMSKNQLSKHPVKSFRISYYNKKRLDQLCRDTEVTSTELINALLENYFITSENFEENYYDSVY
ncbi:ABC transporter substrate-binding protein [Oceanobacillus picturae]|uniref:ABC transporter substrate-binding protein n=2 Tax=Oceanobacillus picturae TaxID=171693 RepID=A0A0U9HER2_9BACI|nr:ABC transporter substrate-binding protein [Oceanobacillus picturae]